MTSRHTDNVRCQDARDLIHDRIDGVAEASAIEALDAHVDICADCRRYADQMRALNDAFDQLRRESEIPQAPAAPWYGRLARIAAAVLIAAGAGWYLIRSRPSDDRAPVVRIAHSPVEPTQAVQPPRGASPMPVASVELTGKSASSFVAMPRESGHPRVHVYILYPVSQAAVARGDS